ncbi:MAG: peptidase S10 [Devosia sp.]
MAEESTPAAEIPEPKRFDSEHSLRLNNQPFHYRAIACETHLSDEDGKPTASVFSISYLAEEESEGRPVTFVFNGGPGSSSMWLHMGAFGPRRVVVPPDGGTAGAPPFPVEDNGASLLDVTDLVFVDPIGTGYSRVLGETKPDAFWGVDADAAILVEFVKRWLTDHGRWNAPRFLAGESYGTTRAVSMADKMHDNFEGLSVNGLILVSCVLDFHTVRYNPGNIMPDVSYLPTFAATAHYHGVVSGDRDGLMEEARTFARERYAPAILMGNTSDSALAEDLARISGVGAEEWLKAKMRLSSPRFRKALLRERGLTIGRLDSRYTGRDTDDLGDLPENDASANAIDTAYVAAVKDHLGRTLNVAMDRPYRGFNRDALRKWDWALKPKGGAGFGSHWPSPVNVAPALARIVREQPHLAVLVLNGLYDLATPFFAAELAFTVNAVDPDRLTMKYYEAGHMMYVHTASLNASAADIRATIRAAGGGA